MREVVQLVRLVYALDFEKEHLFYLQRLDQMETYIDGPKKGRADLKE